MYKTYQNITKPNGAASGASGLFKSSNAQSHGAQQIQQAFARSCDLQSPSTFEIGHLARILDPLWPVLHRMFHDLERLYAFIWNLIRTISDILFAGEHIFLKKSIIVVSKVRARETLVLLYTTVVLFQHIWHMLSYMLHYFIMVIWSRVHTVWACGIWSKARPDRECPLWTCTLSASVCVGLSRFRGVSGWECA